MSSENIIKQLQMKGIILFQICFVVVVYVEERRREMKLLWLFLYILLSKICRYVENVIGVGMLFVTE